MKITVSAVGGEGSGQVRIVTSNYFGTQTDETTSSGGGSATITSVQVNLGSTPVSRGSFLITDGTITSSSKVVVWQAPGPYTNKGTRADEAEMDAIVATADPGTGQATVRWQTAASLSVDSFGAIGQHRISTLTPYQDSIGALSKFVRKGYVKGYVRFFYMIG